MSSYGYGPPPPPPPTGGGHASFAYSQGTSRGSGAPNARGRGGGHYHHNNSNNNGRNDYNASRPSYEYAGQSYPPHTPVAYGSSHPPPASNYPSHQPQWPSEPSHASPHHHHPHAPPHAPIAGSNYHPNYAPQPYPPAQYPPHNPYGPPPPAPPQYGHPYQSSPPPSQSQWHGQTSPHQTSYGGNRSRGGYSDRGASKPSHGAVPVRHGYEHEAPPPSMSSTFNSAYPPDPRSSHYPPPHYAYSAPPPAPAPQHQDSYYGQYPRRGRGGGPRDGHGRGRGGHHPNHHGGDKTRHHKPQPQNDSSTIKQESPSVGKKKKRKTNTLGLTPGMDSETEDDEGEEKVLTELIGQETLDISDIAAFLAERRKNYPTKSRIEAKKAAELAQSKEDKAASLEKQADKLRRQLRKVEFSIKRKREQGDEGDEMRDPSEDSSEDDEPEVMSSRSPAAPLPPPARKADVSRHCKYYSTGGTCGKKGKCRFVHDPEVREGALKEREANNGRLTIQQRLILNDKEQEDLAVLQSIQYLREKGAMSSTGNGPGAKAGNEEKKSLPALIPSVSLLPAASPSLPPPPARREPGTSRRNNTPASVIPSANSISAQGVKHYQGWLLKPYGSSNGKQAKSDDLP